MGGMEPVCRARRNGKMARAALSFPDGECAGATWRRGRSAVMTLTAEPPAHCRLVSGHDLCEMVAWLDCTPSLQQALPLRSNWGKGECEGGGNEQGESEDGGDRQISPVIEIVGQRQHPDHG